MDIEESPRHIMTFPESIELGEALRNGSRTMKCNSVVEVSIDSCWNMWCPSVFEFDYIGNVKLLLRAKDPIGRCEFVCT